MRRIWLFVLILVALIWPGLEALGQIDPEVRKLLQFGFSQPLQGASPVAGYAFYFVNEPNYPVTNTTLRLAVAPVYVDSELGLKSALGPNTDVGIGLAGGGFADSYFDFKKGKYHPSSSFEGNSAEISGSIYQLFNPGALIPLNGVLRLREHYAMYNTYGNTSPAFSLPDDHSTTAFRAGLRWGGKEPVIHPDLAMELSAWYEGQFRTDSGEYGFHDDRTLEEFSQLFWARGLLIYTLPESKQSFSVNLIGGTSIHADRFSAYRLGGNLPLSSEFPLLIPGYFYEELSAKSFVNFSSEYSLPLDPAKKWSLLVYGALADLDYLPGLSQAGDFNSGLGLGVSFRSPTGGWQVQTSYGYGFEAIRDSGRGGQTVGLLLQFDLQAEHRAGHFIPPGDPNESRGLIHFLQNMF